MIHITWKMNVSFFFELFGQSNFPHTLGSTEYFYEATKSTLGKSKALMNTTP